MTYDYTYKKPPSELNYYYVINPHSPYSKWAQNHIMNPAFEAVERVYGVKVNRLEFNNLPTKPKPQDITYVIYGPTNPLALEPVEKEYLTNLAALGCKTNIISVYRQDKDGRDTKAYAKAAAYVPKLCAELGINAIFPDNINLEMGIRTNDWEDVYANIIGETVRVKYHPTLSEHASDHRLLERLHKEHATEVEHLASLHKELRLWQRAPMNDGSILFTHDGYWYSTQTMTDKTTMRPENYDLITSFDEGSKAMTYAGSKLPSSDAPEFLVLSSLMSMYARRPKLVVHFHHNELTRGSRYRDLVTKEKVEGGQFVSGRHFFNHMQDKSTDWFIIREHGVVWVGESVVAFEDFIRKIL